jgi:hypothetical protein
MRDCGLDENAVTAAAVGAERSEGRSNMVEFNWGQLILVCATAIIIGAYIGDALKERR